MKCYGVGLAVCWVAVVVGASELSSDLLELKKEREKSVKISAVNSRSVRNDAREKQELFKFSTVQNEADTLSYKIRVTLEITDKAGDIRVAQIERGQGRLHEDYLGEDAWGFKFDHGEMERPKITAYAIEYGFVKGGVFVPVVEVFDDADSTGEIVQRATAGEIKLKIVLHTCEYIDVGNTEKRMTSRSNHLNLK